MAVFTPATKTGRWNGGSGQARASGLTTRTKKYAVKNAPKSIASDAMKRNMPSTVASTRELWFAIGGPWWRVPRGVGVAVRAHATPTPRPRPARRRRARPAPSRRCAAGRPGRGAASEEPRCSGNVETMISSTRSSRDGVHRGGVRVRVRDLAVRLDALGAQLRQRRAQPPLGLGVSARGRDRSADRRSGTSRGRSVSRASAGSGRAAARRARSRSRRRARSSPPVRAATSETTCSTGRLAGGLADLVDQVAPPPARLRLRMGRDDQLVGLLHRDRVLDGVSGSWSTTCPSAGDPRLAELLQRAVEPPAGRRAARVLVDDVALARLVHGRDHRRRARRLPAARRRTASSSSSPASVSFATTRILRRRGSFTARAPPRRAVRRGRPAAVQHRVPRARDAVLVRAADDLRDLVEVEDRRRRGRPATRASAPATGCSGAIGPRAQLTIML